MSYIYDIQTAVPKFKHSQERLITFYQNSTDDETIKRKIKMVGSKSAISSRYSVINDFSLEPEDFEFFPKNKYLIPEPTTSTRMKWYKEHACTLSVEAIKKIKDFEKIKDTITHIITVTCTGLSAPGLDIELIKELGLKNTIQRSSINFMGCNAAILALKSADAICNSRNNAQVLVVCTELSTLHFQKNYNEDYLLSSALFGDGCAAIIISSNKPKNDNYPPIKIKSFDAILLHDGVNEMAWHISENGFIINLTSYVSQLINGSINTLLESININPLTIDHWAIHPGGKKILDDFRKALNLAPEKLNKSYEVLHNYGNMSSPTILFVLKEIIESNKTNLKGEKIFTAAFGPG